MKTGRTAIPATLARTPLIRTEVERLGKKKNWIGCSHRLIPPSERLFLVRDVARFECLPLGYVQPIPVKHRDFERTANFFQEPDLQQWFDGGSSAVLGKS